MYFKNNTYNTASLLKAYKNAQPVNANDELTIAVSPDCTFEIYGSLTISNDYLREIISAVPTFDPIVQDFCKHAFEKGKIDIRNYMVSLAWIEIQEDKINLGYYGKYVNIELRAIFVKQGTTWKKEAIYYQ